MDEPPSPEIVLQNPSRYREVRRAELRRWLTPLVASVAPDGGSFGVLFTGDRRMRAFNRTYRGKDRTTDVLSFPGEETPDGRHLGDVIVSVTTARRQAESAGHPVERELRVLVLHGLLHCLGYDHETDEGEMERVERRLRRRWIDER